MQHRSKSYLTLLNYAKYNIMNQKNKTVALISLAALSISSASAITISGTAVSGLDPLASGQTAIFVVDTAGDGFSGITVGDDLSAGQTLGTDDYIVSITFTQSIPAVLNVASFTSFIFNQGDGGVAADDNFGIYVFDGTTTATAAAGTYGIATDSSWTIPTNNASTWDFQPVADVDSFATVSGLSIATAVSAVPEPSTYAALSGLLALGYVMVRRRRA